MPDMYPDRIDFLKLSDGRVNVLKLARHDGRDIPVGHEVKPAGFDLEEALAWCEVHSYTVRRWEGGARAWMGKPWVIRTAHQIRLLRSRNSCEVNLDFAYDG